MDRDEIRDANGNLLFCVDRDPGMRVVRDSNGNLLGSVGKGQTRDALGNLVVNGEQPAVLYKGP
jgi:hypothetical protein